ncbi:sucrose-phosphate synthase [Loktanella fryxellensis]|uniref:sucrose-phosphate synthase n=1 Tax=Loktanella fryxellensis TaxID=245187 RepID=A0A1H8H8R4_9RHOB|nr:HAD-IIB family hydrolase [Loktanella fryxellensis]SEN52633.1 sucrose-phosphate synthase [Loktanella fryxellensis]
MNILHLALGGCLTAPHVKYGLTEDTGGHIAYVLGAARAQAARDDVTSVTIVTRAFDDPTLGADHARLVQAVGPDLTIRRLQTDNRAYLAKEALAAELPALTRAFLALLADPALRPDVIHAHFADAAAMAYAAKARFGIPFIYTPHSLGIDKRLHLAGDAGPLLCGRIAQEGAAMQAADAIVVSSRDEAERQVCAYGLQVDGKVHRIWPGVASASAVTATPDAALRLLAGLLDDPGKPMILAIARPVLRKNLQNLARIYADSPALQTRANLVILAGQHGPDVVEEAETAAVWTDLQAILQAPGLAGRVALPARHTPADVAALYALAQRTRGVFVNLALHEPFGLTLLEAASHGLPVVAGDRGGPVDILSQTGHGVTVDPTEGAAVAATVLHLLDDPAAWTRHAEAARRTIGTFDWSVWADHVTAICSDLIQPASGVSHPVWLLGCDIDHTLTGSAAATAAFARWHARRGGMFAVATGRSIVEARRILRDWRLPQPDVFVTAVGTEIHRRDAQDAWVLDADYAALLDADWTPDAVRDCIASTGIALQPGIEQRRWKFGCFGTAADADRLRQTLGTAGVQARVIGSHGRLIDVLPVAGGKGQALRHLARSVGLRMTDVIAAGDSGNDVDMLLACGRGIVVGNALPEIAMLRDVPHLYHATANHAAGVLEGLAAFGLASEDAIPARRSPARLAPVQDRPHLRVAS